MNKLKLLKLTGLALTQVKKNQKIHHKLFAFFRMLKAFISRKYNIGLINIFAGLLAVIYLLSPLDIIPEILLGPFGLVDDFGILLLAFKFFDKEIVKFINWENQLQ